MNADLLASIARVEAGGCMGNSTAAPVEGRALLVDADGLAYNCAGSDDTDPAQARINLIQKVDSARRAARADEVLLLATSGSSHKGYRYAIARHQPYQGKRSSGRRPKNWQYLRALIESESLPFPVMLTADAEADDLFGNLSYQRGADRVVIYTEDKDMRMVPGHHLTWGTHNMLWAAPDLWSLTADAKTYGRKWFWLQMLHGDAADYVPGLPQYLDHNDRLKPVGPVTAEKLLADCTNEPDARATVLSLYRAVYPTREDADTMLLEQACLLWMRRRSVAWDDVLGVGHPLENFGGVSPEAVARVKARVAAVQELQP